MKHGALTLFEISRLRFQRKVTRLSWRSETKPKKASSDLRYAQLSKSDTQTICCSFWAFRFFWNTLW
jgi:hypothetical protein